MNELIRIRNWRLIKETTQRFFRLQHNQEDQFSGDYRMYQEGGGGSGVQRVLDARSQRGSCMSTSKEFVSKESLPYLHLSPNFYLHF